MLSINFPFSGGTSYCKSLRKKKHITGVWESIGFVVLKKDIYKNRFENYCNSFAAISCVDQNAKEAAAAVVEQLNGAESEVKALRTMTQRMILTQKEMVCTNINA